MKIGLKKNVHFTLIERLAFYAILVLAYYLVAHYIFEDSEARTMAISGIIALFTVDVGETLIKYVWQKFPVFGRIWDQTGLSNISMNFQFTICIVILAAMLMACVWLLYSHGICATPNSFIERRFGVQPCPLRP